MYGWKVVKHIAIGWFNKITNKEEELAQKRLKICKKCSDKEVILNQEICGICGCVLDAKARVKDEKCLKGKWQN